MQERQSDRVIRVFICDDNTLQLGVLSDSLSEYADITVVGTAVDGEAALLQIARLKRRKLLLKDEIIRLSEQITPDIIA